MMKFVNEILIDRPIATVWTQLMDMRQYPRWYPNLSAISGRMAAGETLHLQLTLNGRDLKPSVQIIQLQAQTELAWRGSLFRSRFGQTLFSITRRFQLKAINAEQTRFCNQETFTGPLGTVAGFLLQTRLKPRYRQLNQAFKQCCEQP